MKTMEKFNVKFAKPSYRMNNEELSQAKAGKDVFQTGVAVDR